jgi:hypothetical protein
MPNNEFLFKSELQDIMDGLSTEFAQRVLNSQMEKAEQNQFNILFQTYFVVKEWCCRVMIDGETCNSLASLEMVEKLGLTTKPHSRPYYVQWVNSWDKIKVTEIARIEFFLGPYKGSAYHRLYHCASLLTIHYNNIEILWLTHRQQHI